MPDTTAEQRWKEARERHIEKVALKRAKLKKKKQPVAIAEQLMDRKKQERIKKEEKKVDPRSCWYYPSLSPSFIKFCQHGVSRDERCGECDDE